MMKRALLRITLAICMALASGLLSAATAASPIPQDDNPKAMGKKTDEAIAKKKNHADRETSKKDQTKEPEMVTQQSTPVLGVMIGKPMGVDGAEVTRVWPDSPAKKAGLQKGDLITEAGGREVRSPEALRAVVTSHSPGDRIALVIRRDGEEKQVKAKLGGADYFGTVREPKTRRASKRRAWLGIRMLPNSGEGRGVTVEAVVPGSPADLAGIKPGDDILRIDKTRVEAIADLQMQVIGHSPGDTVHLVVNRDGKREKIDVELGAFVGWHGDISNLTEPQVRQLLEEFMQDPFSLFDESKAETEVRGEQKSPSKPEKPGESSGKEKAKKSKPSKSEKRSDK